MAKEYVIREDVINDIGELFTICRETYPNEYGHHFIVEDELQIHLDHVRNLPAADVVAVRHGRWLSKEYMYGDPDVGVEDEWVERLAEQSDYYAYCSACGKDAEYNGEGSLVLSDYCPSCGAIMDGGKDDV